MAAPLVAGEVSLLARETAASSALSVELHLRGLYSQNVAVDKEEVVILVLSATGALSP